MKRYANPRGTILFVFIAAVIMTFSHLFFYDAIRVIKGVPKQSAPVVLPQVDLQFEVSQNPDRIRAKLLGMHDHPLLAEFNTGEIDEPKDIVVEKVAPKKKAPAYTLKNPNPDSPARIAVIIDDMGMNRRLSSAMAEFKGAPLTLAFLPYAENLSDFTEPAKAGGHELMIHMPMEPMNSKIDTGAIALKSEMDKATIDEMLEKAFESFDGYAGLNNHMGSRLTQDPERMAWVMDALRKRGLFYVDSKTIETSVAADAARDAGLDYAVRDVFLDHEETPEFVADALRHAERIAVDRGHAIVIGHPKAVTLAGLEAWVPTLKARGFEIVPVSELLLTPKKVAQKEEPVKIAAKDVDAPPAKKDAEKEVVEWQEPAGAEDLLNAPLTAPPIVSKHGEEMHSSGLYQLQLQPRQ